MENKFVLFINPMKSQGYTNPFDLDHQANQFNMGETEPVWFSETSEIAVIWDLEKGVYRSTCLDKINKQLQGWVKGKNDCRIGVALHRSSSSKIKITQENIVSNVFSGRKVVIKKYHKGEGEEPYCLFCDALSNSNGGHTSKSMEALEAFFFQSSIHDMALKLLAEWLPDYLRGTVPQYSGVSKKLWDDFKQEVESEVQEADDSTGKGLLLNEIEKLVDEVRSNKDDTEFPIKYDALYDKLCSFIDR